MPEIFRFMSRRAFSWERLLFVINSAAFISAIAIFINLGWYNRYMADDYCHAAALNRSGFVHAQVSNYLSWVDDLLMLRSCPRLSRSDQRRHQLGRPFA